MTRKKRLGRPKGKRPPLGTITVRVDKATLDAIKRLEATCEPGTVAPRSVVIRKTLIEAAARLG